MLPARAPMIAAKSPLLSVSLATLLTCRPTVLWWPAHPLAELCGINQTRASLWRGARVPAPTEHGRCPLPMAVPPRLSGTTSS